MKTLDEIIDAIRTNQPITTEEATYSVLVLTGLMNMLSCNFNELLINGWPDWKKKLYANKKSDYGIALSKSPKEYLGWNNDPKNPEYQKFHKVAQNLVDKALNGELPNQAKERTEVEKWNNATSAKDGIKIKTL